MHRVKRWIIILAAMFLSLGALYVLLGVVFTEFLVDHWWFQSLGYGFYFWQRLLYRYLVFAGFTILFFLILSPEYHNINHKKSGITIPLLYRKVLF